MSYQRVIIPRHGNAEVLHLKEINHGRKNPKY